MMFLLYLFLAIVAFVLYVKWVQTYWQRKGVPTLKYDFLFGHEKDLITSKTSAGESSLNRYKEIRRLYPDAIHSGIYFFLRKIWVPFQPELLKQILLKDFNHFLSHGVYHTEKDILSMHLFNLYGDQWKGLRTKMTPTFTSGKMKLMFEIFRQKTEDLVKSAMPYSVPNAGPINIKERLQRYTIEIIGSTAFGLDCKAMEDPSSEFAMFGKKVTESSYLRFLLKETVPWNILGYLGFKDFGKPTYNFFVNLTRQNIRYRETHDVNRNDLMQMLMKLKTKNNEDPKQQELTETDIIAQCFLFFFAGFETSSTTMTFTLLMLSQNQEVQDKLRREVQEVLKQHKGVLSYEALMEMKYLEQVVHEALRMFPPVSILPRECTTAYPVPGTNVVIEKGTTVQIPVWGIHMDPEYYPEPDVFNPERFTDENVAKRPDFTFLPFGEGPRMCIGLRFGMLQTKVGLASLIRNFNFTLNNKTVVPVSMEPGNPVLVPKGNVWLDVQRVQNESVAVAS